MIEWVFILAARLVPLGVPPEPPPPQAPRTAREVRTPEAAPPARQTKPAKPAKTIQPSTRDPQRVPARPTEEERIMLQNAEFLRMLDLLMDLPLLAEDEELEGAENEGKK